MRFEPRSMRAPAAALALFFFLAACGRGPTSPDTEAEALTAPSGSAGGALDLAGQPSGTSFEEFNCQALEEVHVRFAAPGYVDENRVGLYTRYTGAPAGEKLLRIWWDLQNQPTRFQNVTLGPGEPRRGDAERFDLEHVAEHVYPEVTGRTRRTVRAELILRGKSGNCARNRVVTLDMRPAPPPAGPGPVATSDEVEPCAGSRFCDQGDGTVLDRSSGLVWLRDASCVRFRRWPIATAFASELASGQCGLVDGSAPGDWRLPTLAELSSLLDLRFADPSLSNAAGTAAWSEGDAFAGVASDFYWTSDEVEECILGLRGASIVSVGNGEVRCRHALVGFARVWPVRAP